MSEPVVDDVAVELDYRELDKRLAKDLLVIQEALRRIQDYLNDVKQRVYDLENP